MKTDNNYNLEEDNVRQEIMVRDYFLKKIYPLPNIQTELKIFLLKQQLRRKNIIMYTSISILSGMVAVLFVILLFTHDRKDSVYLPNNQQVVAFKANKNTNNDVTLQQVGGQIISVNKSNSKMLAMMGAQVNIKNRQLAYSNNTAKVITQILSIPNHKIFKVILSDGTEVMLNAKSKLTYPNKFMGNQRIVQLNGEAYFKVAHNAKCPFIVETGRLQTKVLGTEFNIRNYSNAYTHVTLLKGSVEVSNTSGLVRKIRPDEDIQLMSDNSFKIEHVNADDCCMWKDGYFYFDNVSFYEIAQELGRWYNVGVVFNNRDALNTKLFFVADRYGSIQDAINILNSLKKAHIIFQNNKIIVD
jgi:transmembrane sensor